ncbi:hypothetical protein [Photorhabdus sp. SF281]|uniref:hypothetical protein n=1 Tax=Photorhabdus sp. SF281 TaxID=3459527 RepID=UPI0040448EA7
MKYDPRLRTFVEDDYKYEDHLNFKKQIEDQKYNRMLLELESQFKLNQEINCFIDRRGSYSLYENTRS